MLKIIFSVLCYSYHRPVELWDSITLNCKSTSTSSALFLKLSDAKDYYLSSLMIYESPMYTDVKQSKKYFLIYVVELLLRKTVL